MRGPFRGAKRVTLTMVTMLVGDGREDDPYREATILLDDSGRFVADFDPCHQTPFRKDNGA